MALKNEKESSRKKAIELSRNFNSFVRVVKQRTPIFRFLREKYNFKGEVLELGAGSCWLSALVSKLPKIKKIYALDISKDLLEVVGNKIIDILKGEKRKIKFVVSDFHKLPFDNNKFDIIICDASLHHAQNLPLLLTEANRVLKNEGYLIAIREPIKSFFHQYNLKKFGRTEIRQGATENIYNKKEWGKYFNQAGFEMDFFEEFDKSDIKTKLLRNSFLKLFNGILFSRYYFFARKK